MGIKFFCPNGHKLNVKSHLAGKKGSCPDCGVKLVIPLQSETQSPSRLPEMPQPVSGSVLVGTLAAPDSLPQGATVGQGLPMPAQPAPATVPAMPAQAMPAQAMPAQAMPVQAMPVQAMPVQAMPVQAMPVHGMPAAVGFQGGASAYAPAAPVAAPADPIAESPNAAWYVRPPSGGLFGPARGDVLRKWISEGRVSGDSLIWREGWAEWQQANKVLPGMQGAAASGGETPASQSLLPTPTASRRGLPRSRGPSTATALTIVVMLGLLAVGLLVALYYVLMQAPSV